ncbi:hypothetical protein [Streptomyces spectabilis]|uniref:Uncharacterized protein n=1 Tax=Streptomyces spectabilis TaxID=68270 RepID=A0A5P2X0T7_STRST|nr:hypothetical protein [Streptomyces spectabilis]MBB5108389.1 hypothetical protein [Streptomyces spectabilis]MCI3901143.1 hypothetical protein [Streptomyces spectabilis]QEV58633.1 hypothetical protein CP982_07785 [Streptomyces spectabilis]GGV46235.1 hypothetical protein GCM10010245_72520 [Streptomyces spectabilis]
MTDPITDLAAAVRERGALPVPLGRSDPVLTVEELDEIEMSHPGDWYGGEWRSEYVEGTPDRFGRYVVRHHESGEVLAELPDWAGGIALFIADAHDHMPALLAEVRRLRARNAELEGAATCPSVSRRGTHCSLPIRHRGDHRTADKRHYWDDSYSVPAGEAR